jgi:hypothetical protein
LKIYLKKIERDLEPDTDTETVKKIKGDLIVYMSLYNRKPSVNDFDYFMKGNYLQLNLGKEMAKTNRTEVFLFLTFESEKGCNILFQYCFEKEPPDSRIVKPNKGIDSNAIR